MADTWMTPDRKKSLLDYVSEGANIDDLMAAGYSEKEIQEVSRPRQSDFVARETDTLQQYTPTYRENFASNVEGGLKALGLPEGVAKQTARGVAGTSPNQGEELGLADFGPLGLLFGGQEGYRQAERGYNTGSKTDMALGALNAGLSVAEAIPGVGAAVKGISKTADKLVDLYDPNVTRMFFGPESPLADKNRLNEAQTLKDKGFNEDEIWQRTGWWEGPNGWRFEVSDENFELDPYLSRDFKYLLNNAPVEIVAYLRNQIDHKDFYDNLPLTQKAKDFLLNSSLTVKKGKKAGAFYRRAGDIDASALTEDDLKSVVLHELQHYQQELADSPAKGANVDAIEAQLTTVFKQLPRDAKEYLAERKRLDNDINFLSSERLEAENRLKEEPEIKTDPSLMADYTFLVESYSDQITELKRDRLKLKQNFKGKFSSEFQNSLEEFHKVVGGFSSDLVKGSDGFYYPRVLTDKNTSDFYQTAFNLYERDPGEIEARLTPTRKNLNSAERALKTPSKDLDIPLEQKLDKYDLNRLLNNLISSWDNIKNNKPKFAEGGMVENIDPISGNEVPPGAKPEEVRDDVPIMASEGEYVIPANVVRYIGLDRIEKMVKQAKKGLEELDAEGRIGGERHTMEEDLPFSPEELVAVDETPAPAMMAEGGMVTNYDMDIDPATGLPKWLLAMQQGQMEPPKTETPKTGSRVLSGVTPIRNTSSSDRSQAEKDALTPTGLAKPVSQWSVDEYNKYANFRTSPEASIFKAATSVVPLGGLISGFAQRSTERSVARNLEEMLQTGKDLNGKPLSTDQLNTLRESYSRVTGEPIGRIGGLSGAALAIAKDAGLIEGRTPTAEQVERYNERVQGDGLINRAIDFITGNRPSTRTTSSAPSTGTSSSRTTPTSSSKGTTTSSGAPRESAADKELGKTPSSKGTGAAKTNVGANNSSTKTTSMTSKSSSSSPATESYSQKLSRGGGFNKGGLIKKRNK